MSLKSLPLSGSPYGRFLRSLRTREDFSISTAFRCLSYSWVLRSLVELGEREGRERGRGVSAFLAGWLVLLFLGSGVGFGAFFPSTLPLLFFPFLPVGLRPWLRCSLHGLMWGFRVLRLLGCWSRQVVLSPFLAVCFFPFIIYYNSMYPRYY